MVKFLPKRNFLEQDFRAFVDKILDKVFEKNIRKKEKMIKQVNTPPFMPQDISGLIFWIAFCKFGSIQKGGVAPWELSPACCSEDFTQLSLIFYGLNIWLYFLHLKIKILQDSQQREKGEFLKTTGIGFIEFCKHEQALAFVKFAQNNKNTIKDVLGNLPIIEFGIEDIRFLKKREKIIENMKNTQKNMQAAGSSKKQDQSKDKNRAA